MVKVSVPLGLYWERHREFGLIQTKIDESFIMRTCPGKRGPISSRRMECKVIERTLARYWNTFNPARKYMWFAASMMWTNRIKRNRIWKYGGQNAFLMVNMRLALAGLTYPLETPSPFGNPANVTGFTATPNGLSIDCTWTDTGAGSVLEFFLEKPRTGERKPQYRNATFAHRCAAIDESCQIPVLRPGWYGLHYSTLDSTWGLVSDFIGVAVHVE